jgi:hypothetical protein
VEGSDLVLDATERRKENHTPNRRALVHDFQDGLTINFNGDYPGRVTIAGNAAVTGDLLLAGTGLRSTLEDLRSDVNSAKGIIDATVDRIALLEVTVASLVDLMGASVVPAWRTKTDVEEGNDEVALGGRPPILSATDVGLVVEFQFERQHPGFAHEDVISISPAAGTALKKGGTVVVTLNLEG